MRFTVFLEAELPVVVDLPDCECSDQADPDELFDLALERYREMDADEVADALNIDESARGVCYIPEDD